MQLFYNATLDNSAKQFTFPPDESKHIVKVLRKSEGDVLHITNGKGYLFEAKILDADQKKMPGRNHFTTKIDSKAVPFALGGGPDKDERPLRMVPGKSDRNRGG